MTARQALYLDPGLSVAHLALGTALLRLRDTSGAERAFRNAERLLAALPSESPCQAPATSPPAGWSSWPARNSPCDSGAGFHNAIPDFLPRDACAILERERRLLARRSLAPGRGSTRQLGSTFR